MRTAIIFQSKYPKRACMRWQISPVQLYKRDALVRRLTYYYYYYYVVAELVHVHLDVEQLVRV